MVVELPGFLAAILFGAVLIGISVLLRRWGFWTWSARPWESQHDDMPPLPRPGEAGYTSVSIRSGGRSEVVTYPGRTRAEAERKFEVDRSEMAALGYFATTDHWSSGRPAGTRLEGPDVAATADRPDAFGDEEAGYLTVTYTWRSRTEEDDPRGGGAALK